MIYITSELIYRAYSSLLADAEREAIEKSIPLDGSWTFQVWTSADLAYCNRSPFSTNFTVYGKWIESPRNWSSNTMTEQILLDKSEDPPEGYTLRHSAECNLRNIHGEPMSGCLKVKWGTIRNERYTTYYRDCCRGYWEKVKPCVCCEVA